MKTSGSTVWKQGRIEPKSNLFRTGSSVHSVGIAGAMLREQEKLLKGAK
jgi:hypothetical protein